MNIHSQSIIKSTIKSFWGSLVVVVPLCIIDAGFGASELNNCAKVVKNLEQSTIQLEETQAEIRVEIHNVLEQGNEYGSPLVSKNFVIMPHELKFLFQHATNTTFKIFLLKEAYYRKINLGESATSELLKLLRIELQTRLRNDDLAKEEISNSLDLFTMADVGTIEDLPLLEQLFQRYGKYTQHLILHVMSDIQARSKNEGLLLKSIWEKSPIKDELESLYTDINQVSAAMRNFQSNFRFFTKDDLSYLLNLTTNHNNGEVTIHIIVNNYLFRDNFSYDSMVMANALTWLREKIKNKFANWGNHKVPFPSQDEFNFLAMTGDASDLGPLKQLLNSSRRAEIELFSKRAIERIQLRHSLKPVPHTD